MKCRGLQLARQMGAGNQESLEEVGDAAIQAGARTALAAAPADAVLAGVSRGALLVGEV